MPCTRSGGGQTEPVAKLREVPSDWKKDNFMPVFKNGKKDGLGA